MFIGFYNKANFITMLGLFLSLASCFLAFSGNINIAIIFLIGAGLCDLFDGVIARKLKRTETEKAFGGQLDSLVDVVSFGVAPIIISLCNGGNSIYALIIYALYLCAVVIRLAYFNSSPQSGNSYQGLPVTYISLVMPILFLFRIPIANIAMFAIMALLYVVNIRIPKPKGIWYVIFPLIAIAAIVAWCLI